MKLVDLLIPKRISGQIAAIVVISIVVIHAILTAVFVLNRPDPRTETVRLGPGELTALIQMLGNAPRSERPALIAIMTRAYPQFDIAILGPEVKLISPPGPRGGPPGPGDGSPGPRGGPPWPGDGPPGLGMGPPGPPPEHGGAPPHLLHLSRDYRPLMLEGAPADRIAVALPDGEAVGARLAFDHRRPPFWGSTELIMVLFLLVSLSLLGLWAARALSAPLSSFAKAAENFSLDGDAAPLPERGPEEIRKVARALNNMRRRIAALVDDRTKMLAAISHDLRTPITRLRLRSEFIDDDTCRNHMLRDLDQMRSMLDSVLTFLRNDGQREPMTLTDIATSLQSIADQFADIGHQVGYRGPGHATLMARPADLQRAVTNLVDNAVRFATDVSINLQMTADRVVIEVEDNGPGISDAQKAAMLKPFVRGDDARTMDEASGFGLGLSIANAVAIAHGGVLSLNDRQPQGLIVRIELPTRAEPAAASNVTV